MDGGTGNWDTSSARWYSAAGSYTAWSNAANLNANFGPAAGTVTLTDDITARSLTFGTGGYTIDGGSTLTLTGSGSGGPGPATLNVVSEDPTTIATAIASSTHVNKIGPGTLILTGNNAFGAELRAAGGELVLAGSSVTNVSSVAKVGVTSHWAPGGSSGTLTIQDSAQLTALHIYMGENWDPTIGGMQCVINQSGGTVTTTAGDGEGYGIRIGHWPSETSTYNLSDGTLTIGGGAALALAIDGTGIYNQTGGVMNAEKVVVNARNASGNGTFTVAGGVANIGAGGLVNESTGPYAVNIGGAGGTLRATASLASSLDMTLSGTGANAAHFDTNGHTITLSGALSGSGSLNKIGDGTLVLSGNTVAIGGRLDVANGTVDLTNSTVTTGGSGTHVANRFTTNVDPINAVLNINSGSSLTTHYIVGGDGSGSNINGTINQYDGTTVTTTGATAENNGVRLGHYPGGNITYNLIGGTLDVGAGFDLSCATDGTGHFHQTGGTLNVERIVVNKRGGSGGDGTLTLEGGTANIGGGGIITDSTPDKAHVNYGGLGAVVRATASFGSPLDATLSGTGANAITFDTNGHTIALSGALTGSAFNKAGAGILELTGTGTTITNMVLNGGTTTLAGSSTTTVTNYVGIGDTGNAILQIQDSATLNANNSFYVGESDGIQGDVVQTGGTVHIGGQSRIAHWANETSTYTLNNGSLTANGRFSIGWDGTGIYTQDGGSSQFNGGLSVAAHAGWGATVNMNGGTMTAAYLRLSDSSFGRPGTVNQSGGTVTVAGDTRVGHWPGGPSTYDLTGGTLNANGGLYVGWDGVGIMNVSGASTQLNASYIGLRGNNSVLNVHDGSVQTGNFFLGDYWGRSTTVNQSGGTVTINGETRVGHWGGETSTYTLSGGSLVANGGFNVGWDGTGIFTQTGGTSAFNGGLVIRTLGTVELAGNGTSTASWIGMGYNGNGAMLRIKDTHHLTTGNLFVGEYNTAGTIEQSGGTVTVQNQLRLGHWGNQVNRYTLSDGELHLTGTPSGGGPEYAGILHIGVDGTGVFTQTGGNASAYGIILDNRSGTAGVDTFTLDGGTFTVGPWGIGQGTWGGTYSHQINLGGGTLSASADWSSTLPMTLTGAVGDAVIDTAGHTITLSGQLSGPGGLNKVAAGTLVLTSHNAFTGGTVIDQGSLRIDVSGNGGASALPPGQPVTVNSGATLFLNRQDSMGWFGGNPSVVHLVGGTMTSAAGVHQSIGPVEMTAGNLTSEGPGTGTGNYIFDGTITSHASGTTSVIDAEKAYIRNGGTFTVEDGAAAVDLLVSTELTGGELIKNGPGTMVLTNTANSYSQTKIDDGVLKLGAANVLPDNNLHNNWGGGGTLDLNGFDEAVNQLGGNFTITNTGGGTPTLTIGINNGSGWNYGGHITSDLTLRKVGTGLQALSGHSTYTGGTIVDGGTLRIDVSGNGGASALPPGQPVTVNSGATLFLNRQDSMGWFGGNPSVVHLVGGTMTSAAGVHQSIGPVEMTAGNLTSEGPGTGTGNYIFDGTITSHASGTTSVIDAEKAYIRNGGTFTVEDGAAAIDLLVSTQLTNGELIKNGPGTMVLTNTANSYSRTKIDAGVLQLGAANVLPDNDLHNNWAGGGTLDLNGFSDAINRLGGNPTITNTGPGTPTLTIGINNGSGWNYGGAITGSLSIVKAGTGWQQLTGNSTYTGTTAVNGGTLQLDGTHTGGAAYTVANGATLGGTGATASHVIVQQGGTLAPNGSLATGELDLEALSFLTVGLDSLTAFDNVVVTGTVDVTDAQLQVLLGYAPNNGDYFVIVDNDGTADAVAGTFLGLPEGGRIFPGEPYGFWISYQGGDGNDISLLAVPEPTTLSLLGLGALAALIRRRRRRA